MKSTNQQENGNKRTSGFITTAIMGVIVGLMFIFGFTPPFPPLEGEGMMVDFGTDLTGLGTEEPTGGSAASSASSQPVETEAITQNTEETIKLPDHKTVDKPKTNTTTTTNHNNTTTNTTKPIDQNQIFDPNKINTNGKPGSSSEGNTTPGGNQGDPNGDPNGGYGTSGLGNNPNGSGYGLDLKGRSTVKPPSLSVEHNETGDVRIKIYVDQNGKVTKAEYERSGSTITDTYLITQSKNAALKTVFNVDKNAPDTQVGYITFHFKLQ